MSNWLRLNSLDCIVPYNTESKDKLTLVYNNRQRNIGIAAYGSKIDLKNVPLLPLLPNDSSRTVKLLLRGLFGKKTELGTLSVKPMTNTDSLVETWLGTNASYRLVYQMHFEGSRVFVKLMKLDCINPFNSFGQDKIYITVGKRKLLAKTKVQKGGSVNLSRIRPMPFTGKLSFAIYSTEFIKPDSLIGVHNVNFKLKSDGENTAIFDYGTCLYHLKYEIMQFDNSQ